MLLVVVKQSEEWDGVRTDGENGEQEKATDDARRELSPCRCPAHERHHPASLAALALPVVRAVLVSPLPPLVPSWPAIDLICDLLDLGVDKGVLSILRSGQRDIGRVTSVCQFWCASVRLLWCAEGVLKSR